MPSPRLTIAVIGAGTAGRSFAGACASAGLSVALEDVMPEKLRRAECELAALSHSVALVSTVEDAVRDADLAVDFVPDELESKLEIWSLMDRMAPPKTVMCTPSDVLCITDLASCTYREDRCLMVRGSLSSPGVLSSRRPLRLLTAAQTSAATVQLAMTVFIALGFVPTAHYDPDLPMLLKNMHASSLS